MLTSYFIGCTKSIIIPAEKLIEDNDREVVALEMTNRKKNEVPSGTTVTFKRKNKIVLENDSTKTKDYPIRLVRYLILNNKYSDSLTYITPGHYKAFNDLFRNLTDYDVRAVNYKGGKTNYFSKGKFDINTQTITGKLYSGDSTTIGLNNIDQITFQKPDHGKTALAVIGGLLIVGGVLLIKVHHDLKDWGNDNVKY